MIRSRLKAFIDKSRHLLFFYRQKILNDDNMSRFVGIREKTLLLKTRCEP